MYQELGVATTPPTTPTPPTATTIHFTRQPVKEVETEIPLQYLNKHFLDQMSDVGMFKTTQQQRSKLQQQTAKTATTTEKTALFGVVSFMDILNNPLDESFSFKMRLYLLWRVDLRGIGLSDVVDKAIALGGSYNMTTAEIETFDNACRIPTVAVFNSITTTHTDNPDIRVCVTNSNDSNNGIDNDNSITYVMWNRMYVSSVRHRYELQLFPFDTQKLCVELRMNDPRTWDLYDLTVSVVQFHKQAISAVEWQTCSPIVKRDTPKHKASNVYICIQRLSKYYIQNIVLILFMLTAIGPLVFALEVTDAGNRLNNLLTLLLTAVTFKFVISSSLPKVPYNMLIDYFVLCSTISLAAMTFLAIIPSLLISSASQTHNSNSNNSNNYNSDELSFAQRVNFVLGVSSACFVVAVVVVWLCVAHWLKEHMKPISVLRDKTWYSFRFNVPPFLDEVYVDSLKRQHK